MGTSIIKMGRRRRRAPAQQQPPDKRLCQFFADQIGDNVAPAAEADQRALVNEADHLYFIPQLITIQPARCGKDDLVSTAQVQLVSEPANRRVPVSASWNSKK